MMDQLIQIELAQKLYAKKHKRSFERKGYLIGYRPGRFGMCMGTIYLLVPNVRKGDYIPFFVTERKHSEQALLSMMKEVYVNGVSRRKVVEHLAKELGDENISSSPESRINKEPTG